MPPHHLVEVNKGSTTLDDIGTISWSCTIINNTTYFNTVVCTGRVAAVQQYVRFGCVRGERVVQCDDTHNILHFVGMETVVVHTC